jgi:SPX domain protein involved in polyphosphate accumulation
MEMLAGEDTEIALPVLERALKPRFAEMAKGDPLKAAQNAALFESVATEAVRKHDQKNAYVQKSLARIMGKGIKGPDAKRLCNEIMKTQPSLRTAQFLRGVIQQITGKGTKFQNSLMSSLKSAQHWPHNANIESVLRNIQRPLT